MKNLLVLIFMVGLGACVFQGDKSAPSKELKVIDYKYDKYQNKVVK
jgi:hypothetical protein